MEAETQTKLTISLDQDEIPLFLELIMIMATKPNSVGFNKKDFTDEQREFIGQLYSLFVDESDDTNIRV